MTETLFCYCCRVHHPSEQMHRFHTRHGFRWRCRRTIEAAKCPSGDRDAFGRLQSEINRETAQQLAERIFVPIGERRLQR